MAALAWRRIPTARLMVTMMVVALTAVSFTTAAPVGALPVHPGAVVTAPPEQRASHGLSAGGHYTCGIRPDGTARCWGNIGSGPVSVPHQATAIWTSLSAGYYHACGIHPDGTAECWGDDYLGRATVPNQATATWTSLSADLGHTCGIHTDGTAQCWGDDEDGESTVPNQATAMWTSIVAGGFHTCGIHPDGTAECWGAGLTNTGTYPEFGQSVVPSGTWTALAAGDVHTCGIHSDGTAQCWGAGAVPVGPNENYPHYGQSVAPSGTWIAITAQYVHTCGIHTDGTAQCWGDDSWGESDVPASATGRWTSITAGESHSCGGHPDGTAECWGGDDSGQLAVPAGLWTTTSVTAGATHTCGVRPDGHAKCWGSDSDHQSSVPNQATALWTAVTAGSLHTCGLHPDGTAECWGNDGFGQTDVPNQATTTWRAISAGDDHTCGIRADGTARCWGSDGAGQRDVPNEATATWASISTGFSSTCGIRADGTARCWGDDDDGQTTVPGPATATWTAVAAGHQHACGIHADGRAQCWGMTTSGQTTVPNAASARWMAVTVGDLHSCGIRSDGRAQCWGNDGYGQGNVPSQAGAVWTSITAGGSNTCGAHPDSTVECWGDNALGQNGKLTPPLIPPILIVGEPLVGAFTSNLAGAHFVVTAGAVPGVSVSSLTGALQGAPLAAGSYDMTVAATDGTFPGGSITVHLEVFPPEREFVPIVPRRLMDTRSDPAYHVGSRHRFGAGETQDLVVAGGTSPVPDTATAVVVNITAVDPTAASHVDVWPAGVSQPNVSTVNFVPGQTVANLTKVRVGPGGRILLFNRNGSVDVIADVVGYYRDDPLAARLTPIVPNRVADTRSDPAYHVGTMARLGDHVDPRTLKVAGVAGVPANATAVIANVTVVGPSASSHLDLWPAGSGRPNVSNLNFVPGQTVANLVVVKVSAGGSVSLVNQNGSVDVIVDVVGYFAVDPAAAGFVGTVPNRIVDTRGAPYHVGQQGRFGDRNDTRSVVVTGASVPVDARAIVANVTVVDPAASSHLDIWPAGTTKPNVSNLNFVPGQTVANLITVGIGSNGAIDLQNQNGSVDVIVDIVGYYR